LINRYLAVGASPLWVLEELSYIIHLLATAHVVKHIVHEIKEFVNRLPHRKAAIKFKIEHLSGKGKQGDHACPMGSPSFTDVGVVLVPFLGPPLPD
jgi:hypothetical protein